MNRKVSVSILILVAFMMTVPISTVCAKSPMINVSGSISSSGTGGGIVKEAGENTFVFYTTASIWSPSQSGGISGSTTGSQTWIMHAGGDDAHININVELTFSTATVDGKTGTMTIEMNMVTWSNHREDNHGTWRIKDAAGELEGLQGGGEWITYQNGARVNLYEGTVHFSHP